MELVLVQPKVGFQGASYWEPLGLAYIAAYAKKHRPDCDVQVFSQNYDDDKTILKACAHADFVGFSCTTPQLHNALNLARRTKLLNPGVFTIFGGYHPTALPFETRQNEAVDFVVIGEGEQGTLSILEGNRMGVIFSEPIDDLDSLPFSDREVIKNARYVETAQKETKERIASVQASRGCPFDCLPCSNVKMHGRKIRVRKPEKIIEEMKMIQTQLNLDFIKFCDATFNTSEARVLDFCKVAQEAKLNIPWGANIHASIGSKLMFEEMKKAGCREVWIGAESGSPKILKEMRKAVTVERIKQVFAWTRELELIRRAYFLVGSPSETEEDIALTEKLADEIDAEVYGFSILCPFPGTDLFDPIKYGDVDWSKADEYGNTFYSTQSFSNDELWKVRIRLADKFKDNLCWRLKNESKRTDE